MMQQVLLRSSLADLRMEGTPSKVVKVRSDDEGEFMEGKIGDLCREIKMKQDFTPTDSPEIESAAIAGDRAPRLQYSHRYGQRR